MTYHSKFEGSGAASNQKGPNLQFRMARSFSLLTNWTAALIDREDFSDVIEGLARQVGGANVAVYRMMRDTGAVRMIAGASCLPDRRRAEIPSGELSSFMLERHSESALPGTIWRLSELRDDPRYPGSRAEREWDMNRKVCEVSLIVMEQTREHIDLIEIVFEEPPNRHKELPTSLITQSMAEAWEKRTSGIIARMIAAYGRKRGGVEDAGDTVAVLDPSNPFSLSRSELRVCQLLGTGLKPLEIATELGVSIATVRTHLRNSFAKTNTSGQVELVTRLYGGAPDQASLRLAG